MENANKWLTSEIHKDKSNMCTYGLHSDGQIDLFFLQKFGAFSRIEYGSEIWYKIYLVVALERFGKIWAGVRDKLGIFVGTNNAFGGAGLFNVCSNFHSNSLNFGTAWNRQRGENIP